jgi:hypothetical protein
MLFPFIIAAQTSGIWDAEALLDIWMLSVVAEMMSRYMRYSVMAAQF